MTDNLNELFLADVVIRLNQDLPSSNDHVFSFLKDKSSHRSDLIFEVLDKNYTTLWFGVVTGGQFSQNAATEVFEYPALGSICVVSKGDGFIVPINRPSDYRIVEANIITGVKLLQGVGLVLFATPWEVMAYDSNGKRWRSKRLAVDGLEIASVKDYDVFIIADGGGDVERRFHLDRLTGETIED